jgi:hypothetical protein
MRKTQPMLELATQSDTVGTRLSAINLVQDTDRRVCFRFYGLK